MKKEADKKLQKISTFIEKVKRHPSITIGEFTIYQKGVQPDKIWIEHESGEGGDFSKEKFEKAIGKFYKDNF